MTHLAGQPGPDSPAPKPPTNTDGEMIEGNITEIDLDNRYILLEDRTGKPFVKIFWSKNKEIFDDKPTREFTQLKKLKAGFYIAPMVNFEELSVTGGLKEANLVSLPYKDRPADFPKPLKKGKGNYQPRNEKAILFQCLFKGAVELERQSGELGTKKSLKDRMKECVEAAELTLPTACNAAGVQ